MAHFFLKKNNTGAAIVQWNRLPLPSCHPEIESQAYHLCCYHLKSNLFCEKTCRDWPIQKNNSGAYLSDKQNT